MQHISRIRKHLTLEATKTIVHSLILSRLDYCNSVLAGLPDCEISKLQSVQNAAAKLITRSRKFDHVTPILRELHWLPVHQRILFKVLVLVYKALHGLSPDCISALIVPYKPARELRSSSKPSLVIPKHATKAYGARAFSIFGPIAYNSLPQDITTAPSLNCFKSCLKTYLFRATYN